MCSPVGVVCFGLPEKLKWKLTIPTTQEIFNIYLIILLSFSHSRMTYNLGFRITFWEEGNLHSNLIRQRMGLNLCSTSPESVHCLLWHVLLDVTLEVPLDFIIAFWKWNISFRSFSYWMKHSFFSSMILKRIISIIKLCSKFSVEPNQALCTAVWANPSSHTFS